MIIILVVDDTEAVRHMLERLLTRAGHTVYNATNGQEALQLLASMPTPNLILSDITMPVMDGIVFARQLPNVLPHNVPLVLMTGVPTSLPSDIAVAAMLTKPFTPAELFAVINQVLGAAGSGTP